MKNKKNNGASEKPLRKIIVSAVLLLSVMSITVSAWFVQNVTSGVDVDSASIQAAYIGATLTGAEIKYGIPGESHEIEFTIKNDAESNRAFAYRIEFNADSNMFEDNSGTYELGQGIIDEKTVIYGIINPNENSDIHTITKKLSVEFFGDNVVTEFDYDGNETQKKPFNLSNVQFTYCQATPAAIQDVFGLTYNEAAKLMGEVE